MFELGDSKGISIQKFQKRLSRRFWSSVQDHKGVVAAAELAEEKCSRDLKKICYSHTVDFHLIELVLRFTAVRDFRLIELVLAGGEAAPDFHLIEQVLGGGVTQRKF